MQKTKAQGPYTIKKQNGKFWVMTPTGLAIAVPHSRRVEAQMIANVFNHTNRRENSVKTIDADPVIFIEGGIVQSVLIPDFKSMNGYREPAYTVVDYDMFEGDTDEDIAERWEGFDASLKAYIETNLPAEFEKFQERIEAAKANGYTPTNYFNKRGEVVKKL